MPRHQFGTPGNPSGELVTGWAVGDTLVTGNKDKIVSLQANFPEAVIFTAQVNVIGPDSGALPKVTVRYTVNGVPVNRTLDCCAGTSISGVAESVRVIAVDQSNAQLAALGVSYPVEISIGMYPRPGAASPTVTALYDTLTANGGASQTVRIPEGANGLLVFAFPVAGTSVDLQIKETCTTTPLLQAIQTEGIPPEPIPLVAGAKFVQVINNDATNGVRLTIVFTIDG